MKMGKTEIALQKAIESGETELSKFYSFQIFKTVAKT